MNKEEKEELERKRLSAQPGSGQERILVPVEVFSVG